MNMTDSVSEVPSRPTPREEPALALDSIQGNIIGFNKDHQTFLFFKITNPELFLDWLRKFIPYVATAAEVLQFNRLYKELTRRRGSEFRALQSTWINIAFSYEGLKAIISDPEKLSGRARKIPCYLGEGEKYLVPDNMKAEAFIETDNAFYKSFAERAVRILKDPSSESAEGNPRNWVFGGPGREADVAIIVASDSKTECESETGRIERSLSEIERGGANLLFKQEGTALAGGREHFGFLDNLSQPGLRGRASQNPNDFLVPIEDRSDSDHGNPGQELVWPGEFIFGYPRQDRSSVSGHDPGVRVAPRPVWIIDGSFLVIRRLRQDVAAFWKFISAESKRLNINENLFAAKLLGRWPNGAPIILAPLADNPSLGADKSKNNKFGYRNNPNDPDLPGDKLGVICPFAAHIRKANPRDDESLRSGDLNIGNTQWHRLLRRGIPYGPPYDRNNKDDNGDRGLVFAAYMTSITDQFEFIVQHWINEPNFKDGPLNDILRSGHDPIIGQVNHEDGSRTRRFALRALRDDGDMKTDIVEIDQDWVIPTGGGYFFAPSIDALCLLSGAERR